MSKLLLIIFISAAFAAISVREISTSSGQIGEAVDRCSSNGGLEKIVSPGNEKVKLVYCKNGAEFIIDHRVGL